LSEPFHAANVAYVTVMRAVSADTVAGENNLLPPTPPVSPPTLQREDERPALSPVVKPVPGPVPATPDVHWTDADLDHIDSITMRWYELHADEANSFPANIVSGVCAATHVLWVAMLVSVMLGCKGVWFVWQKLFWNKKEVQKLRRALVHNANALVQAEETHWRMVTSTHWVSTSAVFSERTAAHAQQALFDEEAAATVRDQQRAAILAAEDD